MSSLVFLVSEKLHSESAKNSRITGFYNLTEFLSYTNLTHMECSIPLRV